MECKRCGKELPVGKRKTCPHCGIYLETIITPREQSHKPRKKMGRPTLMSFISVALVVGVIFIVVPFMRSLNRDKIWNSLEELYVEMYGNKAEFSEEEWDLKLTVYSSTFAKFEKAYPGETENIELAQRRLYLLNGLNPDDPSQLLDPDANQREYNERLIRIAKDEIIDILQMDFSAPDAGGRCSLTLTFENRSKNIISEVRAGIGVYDASGNPSNGNGQDKDGHMLYIQSVALVRAGDTDRLRFSELWSDNNAAGARLLWLEVVYSRDESVYFPEAVCKALWG